MWNMSDKKKQPTAPYIPLLKTVLHIDVLHNPTLLFAPVTILLILLTPLPRNFNPVAIWFDRSADVQSLLTLLGPFAAIIGAWVGARESRLQRNKHVIRDSQLEWISKIIVWAKT